MFVETKRQGEAAPDTKPSLAGFAAWLATKDPQQSYKWIDTSNCAVGQYLAHCGTDWDRMFVSNFPLLAKLDSFCQPGTGETTFGATLARIRQ